MTNKIEIKQLLCMTALALNTNLASAHSLGLQYGSNFDNQQQRFIDLTVEDPGLGQLRGGVGQSDYDATDTTTLTTDYFSVGYSSPFDAESRIGLNYDHWEMNRFQAHSYTADLSHRFGDWQIGLHPEWHTIDFEVTSRRTLQYTNTGGGISVDYAATDNLYLFADYYAYDFSAPSLFNRRQSLPLRLEIALRLVNDQVSSKFDQQRNTIGGEYYFETISLGLQQQQIKAAIDGSQYSITTLNSNLLLGKQWQAGVSISRTNDADNYYNFNLGYFW